MTPSYPRYLSLLAALLLLASPVVAQTDYDTDDNQLIEIRNLAQLNAMRYDLDGNGVVSAGNQADYTTAFPNAMSGMGCPSSCTGYELRANLNFDTNDDGSMTSTDSYSNWTPIGNATTAYSAEFNGNNHTIANLTISSGGAIYVGLFGNLSGTVTGVGLISASVTAPATSGAFVGTLAGSFSGTIRASYATGTLSGTGAGASDFGGLVGRSTGTIASSWTGVSISSSGAASNVGGLVGYIGGSGSSITASYAKTGVNASGANGVAGGLVGTSAAGSTITATYAAGAVSAGGSGGTAGGLIGSAAATATVSASYWDTAVTGVIDDVDGDAPEGRATSALQSPTGYSGIYAAWNVDVDGQTGNDDPWDFGASSEYPALKVGGQVLHIQRGDYDDDNDGLIDIRTLVQLNAIRYDLNGDGNVAGSANGNRYGVAFPHRIQLATGRMGCPATGGCVGYELRADLDFDTNGDDVVDANDSPSFPNWTPIGTYTNPYTSEFKGNNRSISNLTITGNTSLFRFGLFGTLSSSGLITGVGIRDANVNVTTLPAPASCPCRAAALVGWSEGTIRSSYSTGVVSAAESAPATALEAGGLVGILNGGTIAASWSDADVSVSASPVTGVNVSNAGGLVGGMYADSAQGNAYVIASYASGSVSGTGTRGPGGLVGFATGTGSSTWNITASYALGPASGGGLLGATSGGSSAGSATASYWDATTSGVNDDADNDSPEGKSTSDLQSPAGYTGIYSMWNVNVDGNAGNDDPWNFGAADQYPVIKFGMNAAAIAAQFAAQPLSQVRGVSVMPGPGALVVSWTAASNAEGYKVQWKSGDENYGAADRQAVATGTTYTIPNLRADTEYTVRVIATRTNADDGPASDEASETPAPPNVSGVQATPGEEVLIVSWTAVPGATGYKVQWKSGDEDYDAAERQAVVTDGTTTTIPNLLVATEYTVRVIATFANADEELASDEVTGIPRELNTTPIFIDAVDVQRYQQGTEIDPLTLPTPIDGNGTLTYRLTTLPEGLVFDAETLIIFGTPLEAMDGATYTLTATDEDGDKGTLQFILVVIADRMSSFGDTTATAPVYVQNRAIDPLTLPQATGGDGTLTYALTPDLPEGLNFDAETLVISGMSLEAMDATTYTLTATDEDGDESLLTFTLEVMADLMPTFGDTTVATQSYTVNREIESLMLPPATSGDGTLAYFLLPFLPDGLSFDPATRTIAGTPTEAMDETTYTLSALDADGDLASLTFTLDVSMPSPDFNGDGNVNFADFILFAGKFGSRLGQERYDARCDLNTDGQIDFADFLIFAASFGSTG